MARHRSRNFMNNRNHLVSDKRSTLRATQMASIQLFAVLTILQLFVLIDEYNCIEQSHEEEHLKNPLVFDLNTLYDKTRSTALASDPITDTARRIKRSTKSSKTVNQDQPAAQQLVDACQSKVEILTPYYATNSKGKLRTVVNSALMQQAIQVETCVRSSGADRSKCNAQPDCGCEQKYKWHRLLVLDTSDSGASRGLFMDWFLYPSACVCRCRSSTNPSKQFLRSIKKASETPITEHQL